MRTGLFDIENFSDKNDLREAVNFIIRPKKAISRSDEDITKNDTKLEKFIKVINKLIDSLPEN